MEPSSAVLPKTSALEQRRSRRRHPKEILTKLYASMRNRQAFRVILRIEVSACFVRLLSGEDWSLPNLAELFSAVLLIGVALVLPVCIVGSVVQAIVAIGHQNQPTR